MKTREALRDLESLGTAQNRKIYRRHGVVNHQYGVSFANLKKLAKQIKVDHAVAQDLWASGNHDARILSTMVADPNGTTARELETWSKDLSNYVVTDSFAGYVSKTPHARQKMEKWSRSRSEWIGCAGWQLLVHIAMRDDELPNVFFDDYLKIIERDIHRRKNRVRYAMNSALIAIGIRNKKLEKKALKVAKTIGKVEVDHGETSCRTRDAAAYIRKATQRKRANK